MTQIIHIVPRCSWCGALQHKVKRLIANSDEDCHICNECVADCVSALETANREDEHNLRTLANLLPEEAN